LSIGRSPPEDGTVSQVYVSPVGGVRLDVEPVLASWDRAQGRSHVRLTRFLEHAESVAAPKMASTSSLALELAVGLPPGAPLISGGRDLDNYLYPLVTRLGAGQFSAVFGRKFHGSPSRLAVGPAQLLATVAQPAFVMRASGSSVRPAWKANIRSQLLAAGVRVVDPGPVAIGITLTTGGGRNWANLWKPLLDALGPVLGEPGTNPFHPQDDRITDLALYHDIDTNLGHDVIIAAWWNPAIPRR
jgi:hypothetical protein